MKRTLRINFEDGTFKDLNITKATSVKTNNEMIYFDKLKDDSWRLIWNESLISDFSKVTNFEIVRED
jgi:hypothetical protein